ncbi:MAG: alpha/beta hydrolase [Thermoanaerobaculia bacterium]
MNLLHTAHVPAGDGPFPAIITLHGWGASAHDLLGLAPVLFDGKAVMLCPQGQVAVPFGGGQYGYGWFPLRMGQTPDVEAFQHGADALREFLDTALERYPIDPRKVVLAGFSQGGMMGYELALRQPSRFAGLAALSSWFPPPLVELLPKLPEHEGFPVLVLHGTRDDRIDVEMARQSRESLRPYGVAMTYREFDMGHEIRPDALRVFLQWLEEKALKEKE